MFTEASRSRQQVGHNRFTPTTSFYKACGCDRELLIGTELRRLTVLALQYLPIEDSPLMVVVFTDLVCRYVCVLCVCATVYIYIVVRGAWLL